MNLIEYIWNILDELDHFKYKFLFDQIGRSSLSIDSNIAEGFTKFSSKDFKKFLQISNGSLAELETQLKVCNRLKLIDNNKVDQALKDCYLLKSKIISLVNYLQRVNYKN